MSTRDLEEKQKFLLELVSHAAMFKLKLNEHRGDITEMPIKDALSRAGDELEELRNTFIYYDTEGQPGLEDADPEAVLMEAADILNFLLVAVSKAYEAKKEKKRVQYR